VPSVCTDVHGGFDDADHVNNVYCSYDFNADDVESYAANYNLCFYYNNDPAVLNRYVAKLNPTVGYRAGIIIIDLFFKVDIT